MAHLEIRTTLEARGPAAAIVLTDEQLGRLTTAKALPVAVTIGDRTARLRVARMGGEFLIGLSKAARAELAVEIGDEVDVRIEPDTAERTVELPPALGEALAADPGAAAAFAALSYTRRKEIATSIAGAKQEATRERRLATALAELQPVSSDVTVDLVKSLVAAMVGQRSVTDSPGPVDDFEAMAMILEFADGYRSAHGYAYSPDEVITPVACRWRDVEPAVNAYLGSHYEPGEALPVKILVQFDRTTGRYGVTFEDTDESRWKLTPRNHSELPQELRPDFA